MPEEQVTIKDNISSITLTKNSKGINQEVKVYSNSSDKELEELKIKAVKLFKELDKEFKGAE